MKLQQLTWCVSIFVSSVGAGTATVISSSKSITGPCCLILFSVKDSSNWFGNSGEGVLGVGAISPPT